MPRCAGHDEGKLIAHQDTPSRSPYGKGDWVDEWYYIYPDGLHARHVRIYTGLAAQSVPFGFDREPPRAIHEFMEAMVLGKAGRLPTDDIETNAVTLIKTIGQHSEDILRTGQARDFSYQLYPKDFAEFSNANIMLINLKSTYRPFTIGMPHGVRTQPYKRDVAGNGFQVWGNPPQTPYTVPLGHIINYGHHRKTEHILEQVYLSGWVHRDDDALKKIEPNCWAWTVPPKLIERPESEIASRPMIPHRRLTSSSGIKTRRACRSICWLILTTMVCRQRLLTPHSWSGTGRLERNS